MAAAGGHAIALPLPVGEALLLGGGGAALGMILDADGGRHAQPPFSLHGAAPLSAAVGWPFLFAASSSAVRVIDLGSSSLLQALPLPPDVPSPPRKSAGGLGAGRSGGGRGTHVSARSAHGVVLGRGGALMLLPAAAGSELAVERECCCFSFPEEGYSLAAKRIIYLHIT